MSLDIRIDDYINKKAKPFAQPILNHLRNLIHSVIPEVEESVKWGMPFFDYKGPICNLASFKEHVSFGFWKANLLNDPKSFLQQTGENSGMGNFGKITSLKDLPSDKIIIDFLLQAKKLNDEGIKINKVKANTKPPVETPKYFEKVLKKDKVTWEFYDAFSESCKREYVDWITDAKTETTREKRMAQAFEWISEGKKRNWKYEKC